MSTVKHTKPDDAERVSRQSDVMEIVVRVSEQRLDLLTDDGQRVGSYPISTSKYGVGNQAGSERTPLGRHCVCAKVGEGAPVGAVFKARVATGEVIAPSSPKTHGRDLITSRILWLEGMEEGVNRGPGIDSRARYIYIHGTPEEHLIGTPASHGCVRMRNADVIELFDRVSEGDIVTILD